MSMKKRGFRQISAVWLIVSMILQTLYLSFPSAAFAASAQNQLYRTVKVTEDEIDRALSRKKPKTEVNEHYLPFAGEQKEQAKAFLDELLAGSVIVKQKNLGGRTSAIVAVRLAEEEHSTDSEEESRADDIEERWANGREEEHIIDDGTDDGEGDGETGLFAVKTASVSSAERDVSAVSDIFMIGLNGNRDKNCTFYLSIESNGGILIEEATVYSYSALSEAFGPGVATDSAPSEEENGIEETATRSEADETATPSESDEADKTVTRSEADKTAMRPESNEEDKTAIHPEADETATPSEADSAAASFLNQVSAFFTHKFSEEHAGVSESDVSASASEAEKPFADAKKEEEELVLPFREIGQYVFDEKELEELVTEPETEETSKKDESKASPSGANRAPVKAFFATAGDAEAEEGIEEETKEETKKKAKEEIKAEAEAEAKRSLPYINAEGLGITVLNAKNSPREWMYFVNMYDPSIATGSLLENSGLAAEGAVEYARVDAIFSGSGQETATTVQMAAYDDGIYRTAVPEDETLDTVQFRIYWYEPGETEEKDALIAQEYSFRLPEDETETSVNFRYQRNSRDCYFYSGYKGMENEAVSSARIPGLSASYWSAHPVLNPRNMDSQIFYVDLGEKSGEYTGTGAVYSLWFEYTENKGGRKTRREKISLEATNSIRYYQFSQPSLADENTVFQLLKMDKDEKNVIQTYPFMYTEADGRNMICIEGLEDADWQEKVVWKNYQRSKQGRTVIFDNTLNRFDVTKGQLAAVVWSADAQFGENRPKELSEAEWKEKCLKNEEAFLELIDQSGKTDTLLSQGLEIVPLVPSKEGDYTEGHNFNLIKNTLGGYYSEKLAGAGELQVRYVYFENKTELPALKEDASGKASEWDDEAQKKVLEAVEQQLVNSLTITDGKAVTGYKASKGIYSFTRILSISESFEYPCFYAARGIHNEPMQGKWDSVFAVNTVGDGSENTPTGTFERQTNVYYAAADLYDYYSDYELTGHTREPYLSTREVNEEGKSVEKLVPNPYPATEADERQALGEQIKGGDSPYHYQGSTLNRLIAAYYKESDEKDTKQTYPLYFFDCASSRYYNGTASDKRNTWMPSTIVYQIMNQTLQPASGEGDLQLRKGLAGNDLGTISAVYFDEGFLRGDNTEALALAKVYNDVVFPFHKNEENGFWSFDASQESDGVRLTKDDANGIYYMEQDKKNAVKVKHNDNPEYQFFPFNNAAPLKDEQMPKVGQYSGSTSGVSNGDKNYHYGLPSLNVMFGMRMDIPFSLTSNGKIYMPDKKSDGSTEEKAQDENQPIEFKFNGDDDVWIYIDGVLALDLGGIHDRGECSIDFANQKLNYKSKEILLKSESFSDALKAALGDKGDGTTPEYDAEQHTLSIFYMERGLYCSNLKIEFNFKLENSFEVINTLDTENLQAAVDKKDDTSVEPMNEKFLEAAKGMSGFEFNLRNAATSGVSKEVETSDGYIIPGESKAFSLQAGKVSLEEGEIGEGGDEGGNAVPASDAVGAYMPSAGMVISPQIKEKYAGRKGAAVTWAQGENSTGDNRSAIEKRLTNVYPTDEKTGEKKSSVAWTLTDVRENDQFLSFEVYQKGDASLQGSALYVSLLDNAGHSVGGWVNALSYGSYGNSILPNRWNTIRLSQQKLAKTAPSGSFNWDAITAFQFCYYDDRVTAVDNIRLNAALDMSNVKQVYNIADENLSDYGSLRENNTKSVLSPAKGAWYNTATNPTMVNEDGSFSLAMGGRALFEDKFRKGSYLSVRMEELNPRIFSTIWSLQEDGKNLKSSALNQPNSENVEIDDQVNPVNQPGRKPDDGRREKDGEGKILPSDTELDENNTILYRGYANPDNTQSGFHIGVEFITKLDLASVTVRKAIDPNVDAMNISQDEKDKIKNQDYYFVLVSDDIANMGLETTLNQPLIAYFFKLNASEPAKASKTLQVPAGTHYRIYELKDKDASEKLIEADKKDELTFELIKANISDSLLDVSAEGISHHDAVRVYPKGNTAGGSMEAAEGIAYTIDADGNGTNYLREGNQKFVFTNTYPPQPGTGKVRLLKKAEREDEEDAAKEPELLGGAEFALYLKPKDRGEPTRIGGTYTTSSEEGDQKGILEVPNLQPGNYYFEEVKAPEGYQKNPQLLEFTIKEGQTDTVEVTMFDKKEKPPFGSVSFTKVSDDMKTTLEGAEFELWHAPDLLQFKQTDAGPVAIRNEKLTKEQLKNPDIYEPYYKTADGDPIPYRTGPDGKLEIDRLPAGGYYLMETKAPDGFILDSEKHYFQIFIDPKNIDDNSDVYNPDRDPIIGTDGKIVNQRIVLPKTGGPGTGYYYQLGFGLIGAAYALGYGRKKKKKIKISEELV